MGQETSKSSSKKPKKQSSSQESANPNQSAFPVYLLSNSEDKTFAEVQLEVAAYGSNAVIFFPDPNDASASSSGDRKYKACIIHEGHWVSVIGSGKRFEFFLGNRNFSDPKNSIPLAEYQNIKKLLPTTPDYQTLRNAILARAGIQLSPMEKLTDVLHGDKIAPGLDTKSLGDTKTTSRRMHGLYKHEERKRLGLIPKLWQHAIRATAKDIQEIKRILDAPLKQKPPNLKYLRELLQATGTVKDHVGRIHQNRTLYQLALGAREYDVTSVKGKKVVDGLVEMLGEYFQKLPPDFDNGIELPDGETLRQQQYIGQFPKGFEVKEQERMVNDSREFNSIVEVLFNTSDADCQQTLVLDSFHGYDLRPGSWAKNDNEVLASAVYCEKTQVGLNCRFRGLDGQVKTKLIAWDVLPPGAKNSFNDPFDALPAKTKHLYLPKILEQLAEPGQFYNPDQIQKLKELSHATVTASSSDDFEKNWNELQAYIKSIVGHSVNFNVLKALYQFRYYLEPKDIYTTGYHSNPQLLLEMGRLYKNNFKSRHMQWFEPKHVLYTQKIAGLIQRSLTAGELQLSAQGLWNIFLDDKQFKRDFAFSYHDSFILPLDSDPYFRLGYNCFGDGTVLLHWWNATPWSVISHWETLYQSKNTSAEKVGPHPVIQSNTISAKK